MVSRAGGGYIYSINSGNGYIYQYNGTTNASLLVNVGLGCVADLVADCAGNFYVLNFAYSTFRKYNSSGILLNTWTLSGSSINTSTTGNSLALIGNHLYCGSNVGLLDGLISGSTVSFTVITSSGLSPVQNDFGSCPFGANVSVAMPDTVYHCAGSPADTLRAGGAGLHTWAVLSGPASISGSGDTVTVTSTGNAQLILSSAALAVCGSDSDTVTIIVPPADTITSNSPVCSGDSLHLAANGIAGTTYSWHGPNSFTAIAKISYRANAVAADSGYYAVTETVDGCVATDSVHVSIKPIPAKPNATSNSPICVTDSLQLNATDSTTGVSYLWTGVNSFSSTLSNPTRTAMIFSDSGKYMVTASLNGCTSEADTIDVAVEALVTPTVTILSLPPLIPAGHTDTFTAVTTNCSSPAYQWYKNGIAIPGATTNPHVDSLAAGEHISVQIHCAPCASPDSVSSNELSPTEVNNEQLTVNSVNVYPNPVTNELYIGGAEKCSIHIFDIVGREVYSGSINQNKEAINTSSFSRGTYILRLTANDGVVIIRKIAK